MRWFSEAKKHSEPVLRASPASCPSGHSPGSSRSAAGDPSAREGDSEFDELLDTLAAVLTDFGERSFDTDIHPRAATRDRFGELARKITVGGTADAADGGGRSCREVRLAFRHHREHEAKYVTDATGNFREALKACLGTLARAVAEDRAADREIGARVGELVTAFQRNDSDAIRREASAVAEMVQGAIEKRRERETAQISELAESVKLLRKELCDARRQAGRDAVTELFDRGAFDDHVQRTAELAAFGVGRPFLVLIDVESVASDVTNLRAVSDLLVRTFLRADDFVARTAAGEFAVVVVDSAETRVLARAERLREAALQLALPPLAIGAAGLISGEFAGTWVERAARALDAARVDSRTQVA